MKKILVFLYCFCLISSCAMAQAVGIGINSPNSSSILDITATGKGLLIPRMSTASMLAIVNPARGLMVYDSVSNQLHINTGTAATPDWQPMAAVKKVWNLGGNTATDPASQFIGNTDNQPLHFRVNNILAGELHPATGNIFWGLGAGQFSTGFSNVGIGTDALKRNTRSNLVAIGDSAMFNNGFGAGFPSNGVFNVAIGSKALFSNSLGAHNTAIGFNAMMASGGGSNSVAVGSQSLQSNTVGSSNTGIGAQSLQFNTTGSNNVSIGTGSMQFNSDGGGNAVVGVSAMQLNSTGFSNAVLGTSALRFNTTGGNNTAVGNAALFNNTAGSSNTALGSSALSRNSTSQFNTAVGANAATGFDMGFNNTIIGAGADVNQNGLFNCVALGQGARCTGNSQVRLGNSATTSIGGIVGYSNLSDGRYKRNIREAVKGIDFIMKLRPVTYQLDIEGINTKLRVNSDGTVSKPAASIADENKKTVFSGFVAQEVEQAAKTSGYDFSGIDRPKNENDMYGLRYAEFVVPLVKAMQEQQQQIDQLNRQNAAFKKIIDALQQKLDDLERNTKKSFTTTNVSTHFIK